MNQNWKQLPNMRWRKLMPSELTCHSTLVGSVTAGRAAVVPRLLHDSAPLTGVAQGPSRGSGTLRRRSRSLPQRRRPTGGPEGVVQVRNGRGGWRATCVAAQWMRAAQRPRRDAALVPRRAVETTPRVEGPMVPPASLAKARAPQAPAPVPAWCHCFWCDIIFLVDFFVQSELSTNRRGNRILNWCN